MVPAEGRPVHTRRFSVFSPERLRTETSDLSDEGRWLTETSDHDWGKGVLLVNKSERDMSPVFPGR